MSEDQLKALLARLQEDVGFKERLQNATDLDAAVAMAQDAGFDVSKETWLGYQASQALGVSDAELEMVAGGGGKNTKTEDGLICPSHCCGPSQQSCPD